MGLWPQRARPRGSAPLPLTPAAPACALLAAAAEDAPCVYIVRDGDSLFAIGKKFGLTSEDVQAANPAIKDASLVRAGDSLDLPCGGNATEGASALDLLSRRKDLTTLYRAILGAGPDVIAQLNGESGCGCVGGEWGAVAPGSGGSRWLSSVPARVTHGSHTLPRASPLPFVPRQTPSWRRPSSRPTTW